MLRKLKEAFAKRQKAIEKFDNEYEKMNKTAAKFCTIPNAKEFLLKQFNLIKFIKIVGRNMFNLIGYLGYTNTLKGSEKSRAIKSLDTIYNYVHKFCPAKQNLCRCFQNLMPAPANCSGFCSEMQSA